MLPVFHSAPGTAPTETVLEEEAVEQVALLYLIRERLSAVDVSGSGNWLDDTLPVLACIDIGIVEGVDIDGHSQSMLGEFFGTRDGTIAETRGVVVTHGTLITGLVIIDEPDALDGILLAVELTEDVDEILGDGLVAHHLTHMLTPFGIDVRQPQIAEICPRYRTALGIGTTQHTLEHGIGNRLNSKRLSH